ncbi:MAG: hypothetical protein WC717_04660 [Candidatus Micrarchaeia archaeon]|jgi:hypothetical protein
MYTTVKFEGLIDSILEQAIRQGLVKTKMEGLRLGVLELNNKYRLTEQMIEEKEAKEDIAYVREAERKIARGKLKLRGEKELRAALRG